MLFIGFLNWWYIPKYINLFVNCLYDLFNYIIHICNPNWSEINYFVKLWKCKIFRLLRLLLISFFPSMFGQFLGFSRSGEITASESETSDFISSDTRTDVDRNYISFIYIKDKVGIRVIKIDQVKRWNLTKHTVWF